MFRSLLHDTATDRVPISHRQTRHGLAIAVMFALATAIATVAPHRTGVWLPLHLFLAGTVTVAIVTVTVMLAVTWSSAPAPRHWIVATQQGILTVGVVLVVYGRERATNLAVSGGAAAIVVALVLTAGILLAVRDAGKTDRFRPAIEGYVLAIGAAAVGMVAGAAVAIGWNPATAGATRAAHTTINVLAFTGVVIASTLPYFTATQARVKMNPAATPVRLRVVTGVLWLSAVGAAGFGAADAPRTAGAFLAFYAVGIVAVAVLMPRVRRKQLDWAGSRLWQLFIGIGWWAAMTVALAIATAARGDTRPWLVALVVAGYGQIMSASLAYLIPVVRGGGHAQLTTGLNRTRSPVALACASAAGVCAVTGRYRFMAAIVAVWVIDGVIRLTVSRRSPTATSDPPPPR